MQATKYVIDIASRNPVVIGPETVAWSAEHLAEQRGVHYLLVVDSYALQGVVCLCDLSLASASAPVKSCMHPLPTTVDDQATAMEAAELMSHCQIGCLPVVDWSGGLRGIVTRHDLKRAGILDEDVRTCASCGSTHGLTDVSGEGDIQLCFRCGERQAPATPDVLESPVGPARAPSC
jgi:CBS domain-containing protein